MIMEHSNTPIFDFSAKILEGEVKLTSPSKHYCAELTNSSAKALNGEANLASPDEPLICVFTYKVSKLH
jgi:hypothetical protein